MADEFTSPVNRPAYAIVTPSKRIVINHLTTRSTPQGHHPYHYTPFEDVRYRIPYGYSPRGSCKCVRDKFPTRSIVLPATSCPNSAPLDPLLLFRPFLRGAVWDLAYQHAASSASPAIAWTLLAQTCCKLRIKLAFS